MGANGVVDKPLAWYLGVPRLIPGSSSLLDETLSHMTLSVSVTLNTTHSFLWAPNIVL